MQPCPRMATPSRYAVSTWWMAGNDKSISAKAYMNILVRSPDSRDTDTELFKVLVTCRLHSTGMFIKN